MELVERSQKFQKWKNNLIANHIVLEHYDVLDAITKPDGSLLFAFLSAKMRTPEGKYLPPLVFLRGDFVSVLIHFYATDTEKDYTILVKQRRVATGGFFFEFPAGMCDETSDPFEVARKEVQEETGIYIRRKDLKLIARKTFFSSPGLLDEAGYYFACKISLPEADILKFSNQEHGEVSENEHIFTRVVPLNEAVNYLQNVHGMLHWKMYMDKLL